MLPSTLKNHVQNDYYLGEYSISPQFSFLNYVLNLGVFISKNMVALVYVDDCILITKESLTMKYFIDSLKNGQEKFVFTDEGNIISYLGVDISRLPGDDSFKLS